MSDTEIIPLEVPCDPLGLIKDTSNVLEEPPYESSTPEVLVFECDKSCMLVLLLAAVEVSLVSQSVSDWTFSMVSGTIGFSEVVWVILVIPTRPD